MNPEFAAEWVQGIAAGEIIPCLGAGALAGVTDPNTGEPIPAAGESLILAMNNGRPMSPRLMYEFSRAAMHVEQRRGRIALERFLTHTYGQRQWTPSPLHRWLAALTPPYAIDLNRDTQWQDAWATRPHLLVVGAARIMGSDYRFRLFEHDGTAYHPSTLETADWSKPVLFKPLGTPRPEPGYVASDADFVDYITELMGGFAIPAPLKQYRRGKRYLLLGLRLTRDTERMVLSELMVDADEPAGWALIPVPTAKERRYCERKGLQIIEADIAALIHIAAAVPVA
ncbi:MAG: SIR2 family protein [Thiohalomonadaceae bacterium]